MEHDALLCNQLIKERPTHKIVSQRIQTNETKCWHIPTAYSSSAKWDTYVKPET